MRVFGEPSSIAPRFRGIVLEAVRQRIARHKHPGAVAQAMRVVPRSSPFDGLEELEWMQVPTLIVASHDEADPDHPYAVAQAYAERIPNAELVSEEPGESPLAWRGTRLSRAIAAFLGRHGLEARSAFTKRHSCLGRNPGCRTRVLSEPDPSLGELMFWKRSHDEATPHGIDELRDALSERLRLVFIFATLEAYAEWTETNPGTIAPRVPSSGRRRLSQRKCRDGARAKRPPAQAHVQAAVLPCEDGQNAGTRCSATSVTAAARSPRVASPPARRAGELHAPEQPSAPPPAPNPRGSSAASRVRPASRVRETVSGAMFSKVSVGQW